MQGIQGYFKNTYKKDVTDVFLTTHVLDNMYPPLKFSKAQKCMKSGWKFRKFEFPALFEALEHNRKSAGNSNFQNSYIFCALGFILNVLHSKYNPYLAQAQPQCLKITEKVSFNIASEASFVHIFSGQKFIENANTGQFGEF